VFWALVSSRSASASSPIIIGNVADLSVRQALLDPFARSDPACCSAK
jgi:hypothetical protein